MQHTFLRTFPLEYMYIYTIYMYVYYIWVYILQMIYIYIHTPKKGKAEVQCDARREFFLIQSLSRCMLQTWFEERHGTTTFWQPWVGCKTQGTLSDSFFNSVEDYTEAHMESISTNSSYAMRKEDSSFPLLYLVGIKLNWNHQSRNEVYFFEVYCSNITGMFIGVFIRLDYSNRIC